MRLSRAEPPSVNSPFPEQLHRGPSPLARARAAELLGFLIQRGGKAYLDAPAYARLVNRGLDAHQADAAVELLYAAGLIDVRLVGDMTVVEVKRAGRQYVESIVVGAEGGDHVE